jgi:uncharacterized protein YcnI
MFRRHIKRNLLRFSGVVVLLAAPSIAYSQVMITPGSITPAGWARFEVAVVNSRDNEVTSVRVQVPEIISILGVDGVDAWTFEAHLASDTTAQFIEWTGGTLSRGELETFSFLGRLAADAKERSLLFPMTIARGDDLQVVDARESGVIVQIIGSTILTPWAGLGVSVLAFAVAMIAIGLAVAKGAGPNS